MKIALSILFALIAIQNANMLQSKLKNRNEEDWVDNTGKDSCPSQWVGDGVCDPVCAIENNDGGDCDNLPDGCKLRMLGDGTCDQECYDQTTFYDWGDCPNGEWDDPDVEFSSTQEDWVDNTGYSECPSQWVGDGVCDPVCAVANGDGQDCDNLPEGCTLGMIGDGTCDVECYANSTYKDWGDCPNGPSDDTTQDDNETTDEQDNGAEPEVEVEDVSVFVQTAAGVEINKVAFDFTSVYWKKIYWERMAMGTAAKPDGGYYIFSQDTAWLGQLYEVDAGGNILNNWPYGTYGCPLDVAVAPWGWIILYRSRKGMQVGVRGLYPDGTWKFDRQVHNNTNCDKAENADNQMHLGCGKFGMDCMFGTLLGKVLYEQGRIYFTISYNNRFPAGGVHSGVTLFSIDEDGGDDQLIQAWLTGHVVDMSLTTDGEYIMLQSHNDMGLKWSRYKLDGSGKKQDYILDGKISGSGGRTMGRISQTTYLPEKDQFAFIYQRKKGHSDNTTEVAMLFWDTNLTVQSKKVVFTDTDALHVNSLRMARYGNQFLVAYARVNSVNVDGYNSIYLRPDNHEMYLMLLDLDGNIVAQPEKVNEFCLQNIGDMEVLADGRVAWNYVGGAKKGKLYVTGVPTV